jgi:hypothetical protein
MANSSNSKPPCWQASLAAWLLVAGPAMPALSQIAPVTPADLDAVPAGHQDIARQVGPVGGNVSGHNANDPGRRGPPGGPNGPPPGASGAPPGMAPPGPPMSSAADPQDLRGFWNGRGASERSYPANDRPGPHTRSKYELALLCLVDPGVDPGGGEIFQTPEVITWLKNSDLHARRIYLNTEHPKDLKPTYAGHSVGHWEGTTLVVDTVALQGTFGYVGNSFHRPGSDVYDQVTRPGQKLPPPTKYFKNEIVMATPTLHVIERIHKINEGTQLEDDLSYEDPATGMAPYTMQAIFSFGKAGAYLEQFCEDGNDRFGPAYAEDISKSSRK